jgi:nonsense-mediated mRNA decay protein 3
MLYGLKCWVVDKKKEQREEMRMLRWMSGLTKEHRIRNEHVSGSIGIAYIVDKMRENRLKWFGHVMRWEEIKAESSYEN